MRQFVSFNFVCFCCCGKLLFNCMDISGRIFRLVIVAHNEQMEWDNELIWNNLGVSACKKIFSFCWNYNRNGIAQRKDLFTFFCLCPVVRSDANRLDECRNFCLIKRSPQKKKMIRSRVHRSRRCRNEWLEFICDEHEIKLLFILRLFFSFFYHNKIRKKCQRFIRSS